MPRRNPPKLSHTIVLETSQNGCDNEVLTADISRDGGNMVSSRDSQDTESYDPPPRLKGKKAGEGLHTGMRATSSADITQTQEQV